MGIKYFIFMISACIGSVCYAQLDDLDTYLNKRVGSNTYFSAYDQPNTQVWQEFLQNYAKEKGYQSTKEIKDEIQAPDIYDYTRYSDDSKSPLFKALDGHFCPIPIATPAWDTEVNDLVSEIATYYDEESKVESFTKTISEKVLSETETAAEEAMITLPMVHWDADKEPRLKQQQITSRWEAFTKKRQDLNAADIKADIEKSMIMTEQNYLADYQGQADITDKLLIDMYQKQEAVIDMLAKLMLIKQQLSTMPDLEEDLSPTSGSIQDLLAAKNKISDLWEQLWHLRRQLEELNMQFAGRIYGINESIKEPLLYRYDPDDKKKHTIKSQFKTTG